MGTALGEVRDSEPRALELRHLEIRTNLGKEGIDTGGVYFSSLRKRAVLLLLLLLHDAVYEKE